MVSACHFRGGGASNGIEPPDPPIPPVAAFLVAEVVPPGPPSFTDIVSPAFNEKSRFGPLGIWGELAPAAVGSEEAGSNFGVLCCLMARSFSVSITIGGQSLDALLPVLQRYLEVKCFAPFAET